MPRYQVTKKKFLGVGKHAKLYGPGTKREFITVDKPYPKDKVPAGMVLVKAPTKSEVDAQKKTDKVDAEKRKSDKIETDAVTFAGKPSSVQTL